jgi:DNA polymerase eta
MVREKILERFPYLREVPPGASDGFNTVLPPPPNISWTLELGHLPHPETKADSSEVQDSIAQDSPTTWHDVALSIGAEIVNDIRLQIHHDVGYTTSGGIARNKASHKSSGSLHGIT